MILRSVTKHVKEQNWFAVVLDLFIVIFGVFIGIQVANWNESYSDQAEYLLALERLKHETKTNRVTIDTVDIAVAKSLNIVGDALDILLTCSDSKENRLLVNKGLKELRGTNGLYLRSQALKELTTNSRLLAQQSAQERQRFTDMLFYFNLIKSQSDFMEFHPQNKRFEDIPILRVGRRQSVSNEYYGVDFKQIRSIELNVPIDVACKYDPLIKAFMTWERWQADFIPIAEQAHIEMNATEVILEKRK
ncbi:MAG: hypothetical protein ACI9IA_001421 [Enterobacterales bacterium]|jgi:hypothetical protein